MIDVKVLKQDRIIKVDREMLNGPGLVLEVGGVAYIIMFTEKETASPEMSGELKMNSFTPKSTTTDQRPRATRASTALGERIKAARTKRSRTGKEWAKLGGICSSRLYSLEAGRFSSITPAIEKALKTWGVKLPTKKSPLWP